MILPKVPSPHVQIWSTKEEITTTINADMGGTKMRAMGEIAPVTSASLSYGSYGSQERSKVPRESNCVAKARFLDVFMCWQSFKNPTKNHPIHPLHSI